MNNSQDAHQSSTNSSFSVHHSAVPLHILHLDTGRTWRGGQAQVLNLSKGLHQAGIRQVLAAPAGSPLAEKAAACGIEVVPFAAHGEFDIFGARRLRRIIREKEINLVHTHDAHAHALAWMATRKLPQVHLIVSRRVDFDISLNWLSRRKYLDPRVHFLAISNGVRDVLVRGGVAPERISIVSSGVDPNRFSFKVPKEKLRREFNIPDDVPIIGTIGQLVDHKGHCYLIDAIPHVLREYTQARFIIVGEGELRPSLERQIRKNNIEHAVIMPGFREDIELFLSGFNIYALSSHLEGLCTSLADAMLFRLPIVATNTGGVPDLVQDRQTGLLVPPKSPEALANGILELLRNPALGRQLAETARQHALDNFTAESLVQKTIKTYMNISPR